MRFKQLADRTGWTIPANVPLKVESVADLLLACRKEDVPIYISMGDFLVYGVLVPSSLLTGDFAADILGWNMMVPPPGYGYGYGFSSGDIDPFLSEPLDHTGSTILDEGTAPLFMRRPAASGSYIEPNQWLTHVLDLHRAEAKGGWCRLNHLGENVPVLRVDTDGAVCTIERDALDLFLVAGDLSLVRVVDVTKRSTDFSSVRYVPGKDYADAKAEVFFQTYEAQGTVISVRGFDVVRVTPERAARARLVMQGKEPRDYESFKIVDFKHGVVREWEADPAKVGNYFVPSELPFGTSPVFFKPDVLVQYRTDPARFRVLPDRVECVGAWSLPFYVNEDGQVHVYLVDLAAIPYEEQLGWKRFNEEPKGPIADVAYRQDFKGEWTRNYDPLLSLREIIQSFPAADVDAGNVTVWELGTLPSTRNLDFLGYVVTESQKEFEDQILALTQIVVEGLNRGEINRLADALGCRDKQLGSIKQLAKVMESLMVPEDARGAILVPFIEVQNLRSSSVAHRGSGKLEGDQRVYYRELLRRVDEAMRKLAELVTASTFKLPASSPPP
ncbi:MAG: hypothetical protein KF795_00685 [Labilithrix sp.]|nr:hypothetical protein [Labilithrix sp.]